MAWKDQEDEQKNENTSNDADDNFGLPEVEYQPIKREETTQEEAPVADTTNENANEQVTEEVTNESGSSSDETDQQEQEQQPSYEEEQYHSPFAQEEAAPVWPKVLVGIIILAALAGGGYWYFGIYSPAKKAEAEKVRLEQLAKAEADRKAEEARLAELARQQEEQRRADSLANAKPAIGVIQTLEDRTGKYYVVVSSAIDDDLVQDYANKLVKNGVNCTIIPPFGKTKFSRLAVDSKDSYAEAQAAADAMKGGDFGNEIWVVKY